MAHIKLRKSILEHTGADAGELVTPALLLRLLTGRDGRHIIKSGRLSDLFIGLLVELGDGRTVDAVVSQPRQSTSSQTVVLRCYRKEDRPWVWRRM